MNGSPNPQQQTLVPNEDKESIVDELFRVRPVQSFHHVANLYHDKQCTADIDCGRMIVRSIACCQASFSANHRDE